MSKHNADAVGLIDRILKRSDMHERFHERLGAVIYALSTYCADTCRSRVMWTSQEREARPTAGLAIGVSDP